MNQWSPDNPGAMRLKLDVVRRRAIASHHSASIHPDVRMNPLPNGKMKSPLSQVRLKTSASNIPGFRLALIPLWLPRCG